MTEKYIFVSSEVGRPLHGFHCFPHFAESFEDWQGLGGTLPMLPGAGLHMLHMFNGLGSTPIEVPGSMDDAWMELMLLG